jgi:hypothetical protein
MTERTPTGLDATTHRRLMLVLAYLWPLALVPLLVETGDAEVQWHAKHGLLLTVVEGAALMAWAMSAEALAFLTAGLLGCLFLLVSPVVVLGFLALVLVVHALAMARALNGQRLLIPRISQYTNRF